MSHFPLSRSVNGSWYSLIRMYDGEERIQEAGDAKEACVRREHQADNGG